MDKPKLISLKDAIKNAFKNLFDNASLGFLIKSYLVLTTVTMGVMLIVSLVGFVISVSYGGKMDTPTFDGEPSLNHGSITTPDRDVITPQGTPQEAIPISGTPEINRINKINDRARTSITIYGIVASIIGLVTTGLAATLAILIPIKMHREELVSPKELLSEALRKAPKFVLLSILAGILIGFGYLLLIVPGIIFTLMFLFAPYILLTEDVGVIEALKISKELTKGYRWALYKKGLGYALLVLVCFIPLMFLMYATQGLIVYLFMAFTPLVLLKVFGDLKNKKQEIGDMETPEKPENNGNDENVSEETPTEEIPEILEKEVVEMEHTDTVEPKNIEPEIESDVKPTEIKLEDVEASIPVVVPNLMETNEPEQFQPTTETESARAPNEESLGDVEAEEEPVIDIPDSITMGSAEETEPEKPEIIEEAKEEVSTPEISVEEPQIDNFATPEENQRNQTEKTEGKTEVNE